MTKIDFEDSNIALIGSDLDKKVRKAAANNEPAWLNAGKKVGLEIWRIEQFNVKSWPKEEYGKFYSGDSYIVLKTYTKKDNPDALAWDVHFWIGSESTQDEYGTAAYKTVELDDFLDGAPIQHREIQGHESPLFTSYFREIQYLDGGVDSGFNHVEPEKYDERLLQVKQTGKTIVATQVPKNTDSLNCGDVFILDCGIDIYQMNGNQCDPKEKFKAAQISRSMDDERKGLSKIHVFEQDDNDENSKVFWEKLGGKTEIKSKAEGEEVSGGVRKMFCLSNETGEMKFSEVSPCEESLKDDDIFIFDAGFELFVWVGKGSNSEEKRECMNYATQYLFEQNRPKFLAVSRVLQGGENEAFEAAIAA
eukprot:Nk52_evm53s359 gene=Nk52_evmTU53s359